MAILNEIASISNLESAFYSCLQGKRHKLSAQLAFMRLDDYLERLSQEILRGEGYRWGPYKEFYVSDPKHRKISSAPFIDRVAHRAIYNILHPILDNKLIANSFACRHEKGNGRAVGELCGILSGMDEFWVAKLDVSRYFASIPHGRLMGKLFAHLPDESAHGLIRRLLKNHPACAHGIGLPLGNLTSQIFANFYLSEIDHALTDLLQGRYIRYMDDFVLIGSSPDEVREAVRLVIQLGRKEKLKFPVRKRCRFGMNAPVPFLGFLVGKNFCRPLNRNRRRLGRKVREKMRSGAPPSQIEASLISYHAWREFPDRWRKKRETLKSS